LTFAALPACVARLCAAAGQDPLARYAIPFDHRPEIAVPNRPMRTIPAAMLLVLGVWSATPASAAVNFLAGGGLDLVIIDADGDGPDPDDCILRATFDDPNVLFTKTQSNTPKIKGCDGGSTSASLLSGQDTSSDYVVLRVTATSEPTGAFGTLPQLATLFRIPFVLDAYEEFTAGPPDGFPAALNTVEFEDGDGSVLATGYLCDAGGPTVLIDFFGLASLSIPLGLHPDASAPTHISIPNAPYERAAPDLGSFTLADVYIPLVDGAVRLGLEGQSPLLVDIPLADLAPCRGFSSAPALSTWAMGLISAGLCAVGMRIRRRRLRSGSVGSRASTTEAA
jgi:hypothetical protein